MRFDVYWLCVLIVLGYAVLVCWDMRSSGTGLRYWGVTLALLEGYTFMKYPPGRGER